MSQDRTPAPVAGRLLIKDVADELITESGILAPFSDPWGELMRSEVVDPGTSPYKAGDHVLVRPAAGVRYSWSGVDGKPRELRVISEGEIFVVFPDPEQKAAETKRNNRSEGARRGWETRKLRESVTRRALEAGPMVRLSEQLLSNVRASLAEGDRPERRSEV